MTRLQKARSHAAAINLQPHVSATAFKALAAAVVLSALLASTPVFAQAANSGARRIRLLSSQSRRAEWRSPDAGVKAG